jgi:hypothetical protein
VLAQPDGELDLVCLSGRGDKDLAEVLGGAGAASGPVDRPGGGASDAGKDLAGG